MKIVFADVKKRFFLVCTESNKGICRVHPGIIAAETPNKPAYIMAGSGEVISFGELEARANQGAHLFRSLGLKRGDHIAIMLENHPRYLQICCAAQRAGLYYTPVSWRLQKEEVAYIVKLL